MVGELLVEIIRRASELPVSSSVSTKEATSNALKALSAVTTGDDLVVRDDVLAFFQELLQLSRQQSARDEFAENRITSKLAAYLSQRGLENSNGRESSHEQGNGLYCYVNRTGSLFLFQQRRYCC